MKIFLVKKRLGKEIYFDWEVARAPEGYYRLQGGTEMGIQRGIAYLHKKCFQKLFFRE